MADLEPGCRTRSIVMVALAFVASTTFAGSPSQRVAPEVASGSGPIFADGFESGDFRYWDRGVGAPPGTTLPQDPAETAPGLDPTVAIDPFLPNRFLWNDTDPIQRDVAPGAIDPRRICLLRGRVLDRSGAPLRAVRVTVRDAPQLGWTWTRSDGAFDLAVNGGGRVGLSFERSGYLPVDRELAAPTQDWARLEDVVMIGLDP
ncbi:MAG: hypothetical protein H6Q03_2448, partial [Acidobacteria bacterium]|nr:hypothetical protein [Acidobacteriota bacterium]